MSGQTESVDLEELVRRIGAGDPSAEEELVTSLHRGVRAVAGRLVRDPELAQDLCQETLRILIVRLRGGELREPEKVLGFIRGTATNLARNEWRKRSRRGPHEDIDRTPVADLGPDPFARTVSRQEQASVRQVLEDMRSDRDRQILYRHYLAEEPKEEICKRLDIEASQFALVLFRARRRFRALVQGAEKRRDLLHLVPSEKKE